MSSHEDATAETFSSLSDEEAAMVVIRCMGQIDVRRAEAMIVALVHDIRRGERIRIERVGRAS